MRTLPAQGMHINKPGNPPPSVSIGFKLQLKNRMVETLASSRKSQPELNMYNYFNMIIYVKLCKCCQPTPIKTKEATVTIPTLKPKTLLDSNPKRLGCREAMRCLNSLNSSSCHGKNEEIMMHHRNMKNSETRFCFFPWDFNEYPGPL